MFNFGTYHRKGAGEFHGHCIHNDRPPKTRNYTMKGMYGAVIWIALWAVIITGFVGNSVRSSRSAAAYWEGRHLWSTEARQGQIYSYCYKCGVMPGGDVHPTCPGRRTDVTKR